MMDETAKIVVHDDLGAGYKKLVVEAPGMAALAAALQNALDTVECNVRVYVSEVSAYSFLRQP